MIEYNLAITLGTGPYQVTVHGGFHLDQDDPVVSPTSGVFPSSDEQISDDLI
jgi:hypothetical protein